MRKVIIILSVLLLLFGINAYAEDYIGIYIDGERLETEVEPVNIGGRVLVPMRAIFEALGTRVTWDGGARTVWGERDGQFMAIEVDKGTIATGVFNSDGANVWVDIINPDVPARIINDFTYVPVRAVSEMLGTYVTWDGAQSRVIIDSRRDEEGVVYYSSNSDYQKLYSVGKNGLNRHKISEKNVKELEMYGGYVYYIDKNTNYLYRANNDAGEEPVLEKAVNKIAVSDGYVYYQELDAEGRRYGILCRMSLENGEIQHLTEEPVRYPEKYRDFIYYNVAGHNEMCAVSLDGQIRNTISVVGTDYSKLYPFNCIFSGDYILLENGSRFGNLTRVGLDGSSPTTLTQFNVIIFKNQQYSDKIIYMQPEFGQDIYCMNTDGSDNHLVHKGDPKWIDIEILARNGDTIYYKHPMRREVYRVNLDGSDDTYTCYADSIEVSGGHIFASFNGLYIADLDGGNMKYLYDKNIKSFGVIDGTVYFKDGASSKLYMSDFSGRGGSITCDSAGEWVTE